MKKAFRYAIPVPLKKILKTVYYSVLDGIDWLTGKGDETYPPHRLNFVGSADFKVVGKEFVHHFKTFGHLQSNHRVLDVGSGIGRMALPLTSYLKSGLYQGFDIDARGVEWCQKNITSKFPHFNFQYVDLYNQFYNPQGKLKAAEFKFPSADKAFDFVFATSVFTHLLPMDAEHYLEEIKRVLAPDGRAFLTWFVLNKKRQKQMKTERSNADFAYPYPDTDFCFYSHVKNPEAEIAYTKTWLSKKLGNYELHPGTWCGETGVSYQDILIWQPKR